MKTTPKLPLSIPIKYYFKKVFFCSCYILFFSFGLFAQCFKEFKYALGTTGADAAYDIVDAGNGAFFVLGNTTATKSGKNVLVTKITTGGAILWSKAYGGLGTEIVNKGSKTKDGGLLITGSTGSFDNTKGDIMALKIDADGNMVWLRKFGLNSVYGDVGMDIIETDDGGYAIAGIINASVSNADAIVLRLDAGANLVWSKQFDRGYGEQGVGITEFANSLVISIDLQNPGADYDGLIMELDKATGTVKKAVKLHPQTGGLYSPYILRDAVKGGYWISGNLTDKNQASKMQQVVIRLDENFNVSQSYKLVLPDYANNGFTGFENMSKGGFIACSGMESKSSGFIFSIRDNGTVAFSKKLVGGKDRKLNRLQLINDKIVAVGSDSRSGNDDLFIIAFDSSGAVESPCQTDTALVDVQTHNFTASDFSWPTVKDGIFSNINATFSTDSITLKQTVLCSVDCTVVDTTGISGCGNTWLKISDYNGGVKIGDLDIPGQSLTIEGTFNRIIPYTRNRFYAGDIVSKHTNPSDANYLLHPNSAEITTDQGYFATPPICDIDINKTYHVAMVYDGSSLKFYRNGFLMSQVPATGNLYQNNLTTTIGDFAYQPGYGQEGMVGYINEIRIWNVVRTQDQLRQFINQQIPNPTSQAGLLAYYTFDDLKNEQGNSVWNGTVFGNGSIKGTNPTCSNFVADSCGELIITNPLVTADFDMPDSVCVNTPVQIKNNTVNGSNFYWNFCVADINQTPVGTNLGNPGNLLASPVFMDLAQNNDGVYYGFSINHLTGELIRYNFGNSYLNNPIVENLGDYNGAIPNQAEGIQIIKSNGTWYIVVVGGGNNLPNSSPRIVVLNFGISLSSNTSTANNWGNLGNMLQPIDLHVFQEANNWYGFTVNALNNTITRFDFGNNFDVPPTAVNLGGFGLLDYPDGIYAIDDNGFWRVFITNSTNSSITRLDFGSSLLNTPVAVDLGNPGNLLNNPRDILIVKFCGQETVGFVVNATSNELVKLDFTNGLNNTPSAISLGNTGNLSVPHSLSKLFREGPDLYSFITNVGNNTLTRLKFAGCSNSNVPNSSDSIPPPITYNTPGTYNINLIVDGGLATQTSVCKTITVLPSSIKKPIIDSAFCAGDSLVLSTSFPGSTYLWNNGITDSAITVSQPGTYWVQTNYYGCSVRDSINALQNPLPLVNIGTDTSLCNADSLLLNAGNPGSAYLWQDGTTNQIFKALDSAVYSVQVKNSNGCVGKDSILVKIYGSIQLQVSNDTTVCAGSNLTLAANGTNVQTYAWSPSQTLSNGGISNPIASPTDTTKYLVNVTDIHGCKTSDSVTVNVAPLPLINTIANAAICKGDTITLTTAGSAGGSYDWTPSNTLSDNTASAPLANPLTNTRYTVIITSLNGCNASDSVDITVNPLPALSTSAADPLICIGNSTSISANAPTAISYSWSPAAGLDNPSAAAPVATPDTTTRFTILVTDLNGCKSADSVLVSIKQKPVFAVNPPLKNICTGESAVITASGGDVYQWYPAATVLDPSSAVVTVTPIANTTYKAVITDNICAVTDSVFTTVNITSLATIKVTKSNDVDCMVGTSKLIATGGVQYKWFPATYLSDSTIANPVAAPLQTITYHVQVTNAGGCSGIDSITVNVFKGIVDNGYKLPAAFTPNNDGNNDCFGVRTWGTLSGLDFSVYNRWGNLIFHSTNSGNCWDGTYKGMLQLPGAYVYLIRAQALCGTVYRKGTVVLVR